MIYATSDLHGYPLDRFFRLLSRAGFGDADTLFVLGDVIDRNGDGGIAMLRWMMGQDNVKLLLGNHEAMLLDCAFLFDDAALVSDGLSPSRFEALYNWMRNGAQPTLDSLRALQNEDGGAVEALMHYLRAAPLYETVCAGDRVFLLVHSGLENFSPHRPLSNYAQEELLWCRPKPEDRYFEDVLTVLGHTPTRYFGCSGRMLRTPTWIDIDTGAAGGGAPMLLRLNDLKPFYVE